MNPISHEQAIRYIHLDPQEISAIDLARLSAHLHTCEGCRAYAGRVAGLEKELRASFQARWDVSPPPARLSEMIASRLARPASNGLLPSLPRAAAMLAGLAVVIFAVARLLPLQQIPAPDPPAAVAALTASPSTTIPAPSPTIPASPAGPDKLIAFASRRSGNLEVYVMPAPGPPAAPQEPANLTRHPADDYAPVWSPDGSRIAFISERSGHPQLYTMGTDGSALLRLTAIPGARAFGTPSWSPDGRQLAAQLVLADPITGEDYTNVYVIDAAGKGASPVMQTEFPLANLAPSWSPTGNRIASRSLGIAVAYLHSAAPDGTRGTNLTRALQNLGSFAWSPDGRRLAYFTSCRFCRPDEDLPPEIHLVAADGSGASTLFRFKGLEIHDLGLSWSPDGEDLLLFASDLGSREQRLYLISADGERLTELAAFPPGALGGLPTWSPDGRRLLFALSQDGRAGIYLLDVREPLRSGERAGLLRLADDPAALGSPQWQP